MKASKVQLYLDWNAKIHWCFTLTLIKWLTYKHVSWKISVLTRDTFAIEKLYFNMKGENSVCFSYFCEGLMKHISSIVMDLHKQENTRFVNFNVILWLFFLECKRRKYINFHFNVINCSNAGTVYNTHIFAMYEGSNYHSNMALVLPKFYEAVDRLQKEELHEL